MTCPICDSENCLVTYKEITFDEISERVKLVNVETIDCQECGEVTYELPNFNILVDQIIEQICVLTPPLKGGEIYALRSSLDYSGQYMSKILGVTNVSLSRWENGSVVINLCADHFIRNVVLTKYKYKPERIDELLANLENTSLNEIRIDMNDFNKKQYKISYCVPFGTDNGQVMPWMLVNE